jgi:hypothetical protein
MKELNYIIENCLQCPKCRLYHNEYFLCEDRNEVLTNKLNKVFVDGGIPIPETCKLKDVVKNPFYEVKMMNDPKNFDKIYYIEINGNKIPISIPEYFIQLDDGR